MPIRYKLTNKNLTTYNNCYWTLNEWKETSGEGDLCSPGWLHCYSNPLLAILLNPLHANIPYPKLFEVEVEGKTKKDKGLKEGWTRMRLIKELEVPKINDIQKRAFGILCALEVYKEEKFVNWANNWLNGTDRTKEAAEKINDAIDYCNGTMSFSGYAAWDALNAVISNHNYANKYANAANSAADVADVKRFSNSSKNKTINFKKLAKKAMEIND